MAFAKNAVVLTDRLALVMILELQNRFDLAIPSSLIIVVFSFMSRFFYYFFVISSKNSSSAFLV